MRRKSRFRHMTMQTGIPDDAWGAGARVTMMGSGCVLVEGHRGIVELSENRIRLRTRGDIVSVQGDRLEVQELSMDGALIRGRRIEGISCGRQQGG